MQYGEKLVSKYRISVILKPKSKKVSNFGKFNVELTYFILGQGGAHGGLKIHCLNRINSTKTLVGFRIFF